MPGEKNLARKPHEFMAYLELLSRVENTIADQKLESKSSDTTIKNSKLEYLKEDYAHTLMSLESKDGDQSYRRQTVRFAEKVYLGRLFEVCQSLQGQVSATVASQLLRIQRDIAARLHFSPSAFQGPFHNPYPEHLLFSQRFHSPHFSNKSGRDYVQNISVDTMAGKLMAHTVAPDQLRIEAYFAKTGNASTSLFAANNRTWATFCRAHVEPSRIVPCLPTQDWKNRIDTLKTAQHDPNTIYQETDEEKGENRKRGKPVPPPATRSLRPSRLTFMPPAVPDTTGSHEPDSVQDEKRMGLK